MDYYIQAVTSAAFGFAAYGVFMFPYTFIAYNTDIIYKAISKKIKSFGHSIDNAGLRG